MSEVNETKMERKTKKDMASEKDKYLGQKAKEGLELIACNGVAHKSHGPVSHGG